MGPRTEPWGTPYKRGEGVDRVLSTKTLEAARKVRLEP